MVVSKEGARGEKGKISVKYSCGKEDNQQQTQPAYDDEFGIQALASLVGG